MLKSHDVTLADHFRSIITVYTLGEKTWKKLFNQAKHHPSFCRLGFLCFVSLPLTQCNSEAPAETVRGSQNGAKSDDTVMDGPDKRSEFFVKTEVSLG